MVVDSQEPEKLKLTFNTSASRHAQPCIDFAKLPEAVQHALMVLIVLKISNENQAKVTVLAFPLS